MHWPGCTSGASFLVLGAVLGASMFPGVALVTPLFQLFTNIHWLGTYEALILPDISFALPLTVWILTSFFAEMPWELEQAARIDGCTPGPGPFPAGDPAAGGAGPVHHGDPRVHLGLERVPVVQPAVQRETRTWKPVTVAIANFTGAQPHQEPYTAVMAAGAIVTVPLVLLVLLFQRRIVSGLTAGAVK